MPSYDLQCTKCDHIYDVLVPYDKVKDCTCPECGSKKKEQLITRVNIGGPTSSKMDNFGYRAGFNMERAKGERRKAEELSHMGQDPYQTPGIAIDDTPMGEGIHHPFPLKD